MSRSTSVLFLLSSVFSYSIVCSRNISRHDCSYRMFLGTCLLINAFSCLYIIFFYFWDYSNYFLILALSYYIFLLWARHCSSFFSSSPMFSLKLSLAFLSYAWALLRSCCIVDYLRFISSIVLRNLLRSSSKADNSFSFNSSSVLSTATLLDLAPHLLAIESMDLFVCLDCLDACFYYEIRSVSYRLLNLLGLVLSILKLPPFISMN